MRLFSTTSTAAESVSPATSAGANGRGERPHAAVLRSIPLDHAPGTNPWVEAVARGRAEFAGAFGDLARSRRNWQLAAFGALGVAGVLSVGFVTLATQSRITPYVVEVDRLGRARAFAPAERIAAADQRIVTSAVAGWVRDIRTVVADAVAQQDMVRRAYAFVDQGAAGWLDAYFTDPARDPRVLAATLSRTVEVTSVLPLPAAPGPGRPGPNAPATWKVAWLETDYPRGGGPSTTAAWEGYLTTRQVPPTTSDRMEANPLGLFITSVNWTQVTAPRPATDQGATGAPAWSAPVPASASSVPTPGGTP